MVWGGPPWPDQWQSISLRASATSQGFAGTARWFGTLGVLLALGLAAFSDRAIAQPSSADLLSIDSLTTGPGSAAFTVRLADGVDWSDQKTGSMASISADTWRPPTATWT